jgi:5-methylcytosine-specific restriction protein A
MHCMLTGGRKGDYARQQVYARDRAVCALCSIDTKKVAAQARKIAREHGVEAQKSFLMEHGVPKNKKVRVAKFGGGLFEVDHVTPCIEGGGLADLNNLRTLCYKCHRMQTAALAGRRAAARRVAETAVE